MLTGIAIAAIAFVAGAYHQDKVSRRVKITDANGVSFACHSADVEKVVTHAQAMQSSVSNSVGDSK
jgi:hypothetical protein